MCAVLFECSKFKSAVAVAVYGERKAHQSALKHILLALSIIYSSTKNQEAKVAQWVAHQLVVLET